MTTIRPAIIGDLGEKRIVTLNDIVNLDAVEHIETHCWSRRKHFPRLPVFFLPTTVTDSATSKIEVDLGTDGTGLTMIAPPGFYFWQYEVTFDDGSVLTWPLNRIPDLFQLIPQIA